MESSKQSASSLWIRLTLPAVLTVFLFMGAIFLFFIPDFEKQYLSRKKEMLSEVTGTAWSILSMYENQERQGLLSREEAQHLAVEQIRALRYGTNRLDYFWLTDMQHRMVMHPYRPELEGLDTTLVDDADDNGTPLSVKFVRVVRESGEGFVRYNWQWKNDPEKFSPKLSFVKGFQPWDWYIGTGVYIDDVMAETADIRRNALVVTGGIFLLVSLLTSFIIRQALLVERRQRKAEDALLGNRKRYKELADSLPQFVFETDRKGSFTFVNRYFMETLKYSQEDIDRGMLAVNVLVPEDRERALENLQRIFAGEKRGNAEYTILCRDGHTFPVLVHSQAIVTGDTAMGIRGVAIDITKQYEARAQREMMERQMRQTTKMETIGTLAGGIAHDFNNILAAILGYADLVKESLPQNDPNSYNIEQVMRASYRAKGLVKQILTFSRQEEQEKQPLQIGLIIEETCTFLRASLPASIDIGVKITASPEKLILADATQIHQLILNICTNSAHAMAPDGGKIRILLSEAAPAGQVLSQNPDITGKSCLKMDIMDTGPGIPPDIIDRIFDPFFTTKERGEGTGMGLALAHGIVKNHDGLIGVVSRMGEGTTTTVYLPVYEGVAAPQVEEDPPPPGGSERILLVDDEEMIVNMSSILFKNLGYDIVTTTRGHEAIEILRREPERFDLLITDLSMPDLTGLELAEEVRKIRPDIPVILCTGFAEQVDMETLKNEGISDIVFKPPLKRDIANAVRRALDGRKVVSWQEFS